MKIRTAREIGVMKDGMRGSNPRDGEEIGTKALRLGRRGRIGMMGLEVV